MDIKISGLSSDAVADAIGKYGSNQLTRQETETFWDKYKGNFDDPIIKILILALVINIVFVFMGKTHWYESAGIALAVLLATLVSTWSEHKNESTFQKLQEDAGRITCKVFRDGNITQISIDDIVAGDYVLLQPGDKIPADGILYRGEMKVDQASLNGESAEALKVEAGDGYTENDKTVDFLDPCRLFRGSVVYSGEAVMLVKSVGDNSQYGKLALEMQTDERESPLKVKLGSLAGAISKFGYIGGVLIAVTFVFRKIVIDNHFNIPEIIAYLSVWQNSINDVVNAVILAVIIIVVAVPEGLPMMIAMVLSLNMRKMLNDNILVRKLVGIETSGSLNILFSDKTGTITRGRLEAITFIGGDNKAFNTFESVDKDLQELLYVSLMGNTNAMIAGDKEGLKIIGGNATERALLSFVTSGKSEDAEKSPALSLHNIKKVFSIPFSSDRKFSATRIEGARNITLIKGAPEQIIGKCSKYYARNGEICKLEDKAQLEKTMNDLAERAIRVIAVATSEEHLQEETPIADMTLVGIVGIRDEVRPEAVSAIKEVQDAGIQVVMITGDRKETAVAIARDSGLIKRDEDIILTSDALQELTDEELKKILPDLRIIARALPTDKSRLVKIAQELNLVVGMTGDGVNDAPALKKSDVGFAMGSGTEVAKEAGDIVILDDNFSSIEKAVLYGRTIFKSIRKFIVFQLTINVSAVLITFMGPLMGLAQPLSITQMLWVNLVMDTLAAIAFGGEPALRRYMKELPKRRDEQIVSTDMWSAILTCGIFVSLLSLYFLKAEWIVNSFRTGPDGSHDLYLYTGFFSFFVFISILNGLNARSEGLNLFEHIGLNTGFIKVMSMILVIQVIMTYAGGVILRTHGLVFNEWLVVVGLASLVIPLDLCRKLILRRSVKP
ncbi:Calcium-translocating P-type ATPase, PMCA-type [Desulfamplus magnetovallimortis]|uniref:P-type Ca(2+) transporter n=1 Tax=Desulfamplus magnetovallimortis TaxID=1246637 RepID=A0A1W1HHN9_9BACT|nr:calcium-translocating P-type ATPase, PMCA-type [Desulfamplus magnetovallimortis]SLM31956.1 Calcium-translocating P-type ATPase, PMCA-type [Desulfamplus magnetovallimortis]